MWLINSPDAQAKFTQYFEDEEIPAEDLPESAIPKTEDEGAEEEDGKKSKKDAKREKAAGDEEDEKPKKSAKKVKVRTCLSLDMSPLRKLESTWSSLFRMITRLKRRLLARKKPPRSARFVALP